MKVTVLTGGTSSERDVALASAVQVVAALRKCGHAVAVVDTARGYIPEADEARERRALNVARGVIVVVVEADLSDGHDLGRAGERLELVVEGVRQRGRVVRVDARGGADVVAPLRERDRVARRTEIAPHADDDEASDSSRARAGNCFVGVREVVRVEVAVCVDEHQNPTLSVPPAFQIWPPAT